MKAFGLTLLLLFPVFLYGMHNPESPFPLISGWNLTIDDIVYDANNLWDAIDGAADLYLEYNFISLHIGTYINTDSIEVKAEIYHHGSEINAFGIYSQERDPNYNFTDIGIQGYIQKGVLNFLSGQYYIKLSTYQTGDKAQQALQIIARHLDKHLDQKITLPDVLVYFPSEGKQTNTEQYIARNFLGYNTLNNVFTANYFDGIPFKIFIIETPNMDKSRSILTEFLKLIPQENIKAISKDRYGILDQHSGMIELQLANNYIFGVINCKNRETREKYLDLTVSNLLK